MHRYYKISHEWAEKLGESETAPRHPDGMHLVMPGIAVRIIEILQREEGLNLLREEAFAHIGAIGLTVAEAAASKRGELRHDAAPLPPEGGESDESSDKPENDENAETPDD